jgi:hypothetical protein
MESKKNHKAKYSLVNIKVEDHVKIMHRNEMFELGYSTAESAKQLKGDKVQEQELCTEGYSQRAKLQIRRSKT